MALWYAGSHSTDAGNNTGWIFAAPGAGILSLQLDDIAITASGSIDHNGSASLQLDDIAPSANGSITHNGSASVQMDDISPVFAGNDVHSGFISIQLDDLAVQFDGQVIPPAPTAIVTKGGTDKHKKHRNFKNQKDQTERDIQRAVNKVFGIEEPDETAEIAEIQQPKPTPDFSAEIQRMALEAQANAIGQTIEQYQAMLDAERDDEEALLLLF